MAYIATQTIASGFGTFHIGDEVDADLPEPVADVWLAAGLIEPAPETAMTDESAPGRPARRPSRARKPQSPSRVVTAPSPQRRLVEDTSAPAPETAMTGPQA